MSKLLNRDGAGRAHQELDDMVVNEDDYLICNDGDIPSISFSENVRKVLEGGMACTLVIKLLG